MGAPNMVEWCGGSVTAPGWGDQPNYPAQQSGKPIDITMKSYIQLLEDGFMISDAKNTNQNQILASRMPHGALVFQVTPTSYTGQIFTVNNIATPSYTASCDSAYVIAAAVPGVANSTPCVNTINGAVPSAMVYQAVPACNPGFVSLNGGPCSALCNAGSPTGCTGMYTFGTDTSIPYTTGCMPNSVAGALGASNAWVSGVSTCTACAGNNISAGWTSGPPNTCAATTLANFGTPLCTNAITNTVSVQFTGGSANATSPPTASDMLTATSVLGLSPLAGGVVGTASCTYSAVGLAATCGTATCTTTGAGAFTCVGSGIVADYGFGCAAVGVPPVGSLADAVSVPAFSCSAGGASTGATAMKAVFSGANYPAGSLGVSAADLAYVNAGQYAFSPNTVSRGSQTFASAASGTAVGTCVVTALNTVTCYGFPLAAGYQCSVAGSAAVAGPVLACTSSTAWYALYSSTTCYTGSPTVSAACCSAIVSTFKAGGSMPGCLCEAETAAFILGALGSAGNQPQGKAAIPLVGANGYLFQCAAAGNLTGVKWPTGNSASPYDCGSSFIPVPAVIPGSVRAPYVMAVTNSSAIIRWRTATAGASTVSCGTSMAALSICAYTDLYNGNSAVVEHSSQLLGLTAGTVYYYAVGSSAASATQFFKTAPAVSASPTSLRMWVMGDYGEQSGGSPSTVITDNMQQQNVLTSWLNYEAATGKQADLFLSLGDTTYNSGACHSCPEAQGLWLAQLGTAWARL